MESLLAAGAPWPGAVAVSGGGDSIALMHLLAGWAKDTRRAPPLVVTVDHGLREASAADARKVARWARAAKLRAHTLRRRGPRPKSDIEAAAREARYALMGAWAAKRKIAALYVAHTRDDQAETFLLRLMRGSGLDGLAAMRPVAPYPMPGFAGLCVVRPLLSLPREALRAHLVAGKRAWLEDPMNDEARFARVRLRQLLPALEEAGLTRARIAGAAAHLARAREALDTVTAAVLARVARRRAEGVHVDVAALVSAPREVALRALAELLMTVSGQAYRPRFERLERLLARLTGPGLGGGCTLHGCRLFPAPSRKGVFAAGTLVIAPETGSARGKKSKNGTKA
ncbi:MAG TPA: tRNA lysidine(34) synthetase TilS [Rhizomicrobium sp.]|jgi:tRNA(Ile)-lysidine synthase|nr:tRNA lysidine(34) synthetase TilS [Rhizomicrobium sp.]